MVKSYIVDKDAFIFSVDSKEKYDLKKELNGNNAIYHSSSSYCCCYGYCGDDLAVSEKFLNKNVSYCCGNEEYKSFNTNNLNLIGKDVKGKIKFEISELEIYKVNIEDLNYSKQPINNKNDNNIKVIDSLIIKDEKDIKMIKSWIRLEKEFDFV